MNPPQGAARDHFIGLRRLSGRFGYLEVTYYTPVPPQGRPRDPRYESLPGPGFSPVPTGLTPAETREPEERNRRVDWVV